MADKPWYDEGKSEEDRLYEDSILKIKAEVQEKKKSFEEAAAGILVADEAVRAAILDDALKVLIADMHFARGMALEELANKLKLPVERIQLARTEMIQQVEQEAIDKYKTETGQTGEA